MKENNSIAQVATNRRTVSLRKMCQTIELLHQNVMKINDDEACRVEATSACTDSGLYLNFLGDNFNLSINLVVTK